MKLRLNLRLIFIIFGLRFHLLLANQQILSSKYDNFALERFSNWCCRVHWAIRGSAVSSGCASRGPRWRFRSGTRPATNRGSCGCHSAPGRPTLRATTISRTWTNRLKWSSSRSPIVARLSTTTWTTTTNKRLPISRENLWTNGKRQIVNFVSG